MRICPKEILTPSGVQIEVREKSRGGKERGEGEEIDRKGEKRVSRDRREERRGRKIEKREERRAGSKNLKAMLSHCGSATVETRRRVQHCAAS